MADANSTIQRPFVLVPLYIYPTAESWEPLFSSARLHTGLDFVVVVNPNNGPGCHPTPDDNYMTALQRLSQLPNVKVLGYIYCSYGNRPSAEAEKEVRVYHGWTDQGIRIDGIFFDEVPPGLEHLDYMADISTTARTILLGLRSANGNDNGTLAPVAAAAAAAATAAATKSTAATTAAAAVAVVVIVYNPGIFTNREFYSLADFIVVFENQAAEWDSDYVRANLVALPAALRARSIAIAHSATHVGQQLRFGEEAVVGAGLAGHFCSSVKDYSEWCPDWKAYAKQADEMRMC